MLHALHALLPPRPHGLGPSPARRGVGGPGQLNEHAALGCAPLGRVGTQSQASETVSGCLKQDVFDGHADLQPCLLPHGSCFRKPSKPREMALATESTVGAGTAPAHPHPEAEVRLLIQHDTGTPPLMTRNKNPLQPRQGRGAGCVRLDPGSQANSSCPVGRPGKGDFVSTP